MENQRSKDVGRIAESIGVAKYSLYAAIGIGILSLILSGAAIYISYRTWKDAETAAILHSEEATSQVSEQQKLLVEIRDSIHAETAGLSSSINNVAGALKREQAPPPQKLKQKR